jgi:hypothetical protein
VGDVDGEPLRLEAPLQAFGEARLVVDHQQAHVPIVADQR